MKALKIISLVLTLGIIISCNNSKTNSKIVKTDSNGFKYKIYENDPTGLRLYTLDNGLKVYLSKNTDAPRIQTYIAVKAGSVYDPSDNTGLAHYLEHMLFKGNDKFGTLDWEKEKPLLQKISNLYETHKAEQDSQKKKEIYKKIDSISQLASNISIASEYDKMVTSIGAKGTNAHTWHEETIYKNNIPSNELDKWLELESIRFSKIVLRLFHTELETVYEEFNRGQDNDRAKSHYKMLENLFPNHPYGQQKVIGKPNHLKNPSMVAIHNYFNKYYVPNNMAVILVGDIDFDSTIQQVNNTFGKFERKELKRPERPKEQPITAPIKREVFGPQAERITLAFRTQGVGSNDELFISLISQLLSNGKAGLMDLNLIQKQSVQRANVDATFLNDYGYFAIYGMPKEGQNLDDVKELLLNQIEILKSGEFDDWLPKAIINNMKLSLLRRYENANAVAKDYYRAFVHFQNWDEKVRFISKLEKITKADIVTFAKNFFKNNYVEVYKRQGKSSNQVKIEKPKITPVNLNKDKQSSYFKAFSKKETKSIQPLFLDFEKEIKHTTSAKGLHLDYINNATNDLAELNIIFDMGSANIKKLPQAFSYLKFLGTDKYSSEEIKKEFYKLGVDYNVSTGSDRSFISISGLNENLGEGLKLLDHLISNAIMDQEAYDKYVSSIAKNRENTKSSKNAILFSGLAQYALYGENSKQRDIYTIEELRGFDPQELVNLIKDLKNYKQRAFYYGKDADYATRILDEKYTLPKILKDYPKKKKYLPIKTKKKVYYVEYDMVQSEMILISSGDLSNIEKMAPASLFNNYFGRGLSSIVFQEIREARSLAYAAQVNYASASKKENFDFVFCYVGTQADKIPKALKAVTSLMNDDMPENKVQFESSKDALLKQIASERVNRSSIFWMYESMKDLGINYDLRKDNYNKIKNMSLSDLTTFFNNNIKDRKYTLLIIGNKKDLAIKKIKEYGKFKELDVDYIFNY